MMKDKWNNFNWVEKLAFIALYAWNTLKDCFLIITKPLILIVFIIFFFEIFRYNYPELIPSFIPEISFEVKPEITESNTLSPSTAHQVKSNNYLLFLFIEMTAIFLLSIFGLTLIKAIREYYLLKSIPIAKIRSAAAGYNSIIGRAYALKPELMISSPVYEVPCLGYSWEIQLDHKTKKNRWRTMISGHKSSMFLLDDGTGQMVIDGRDIAIYGGYKLHDLYLTINRKQYVYREYIILPTQKLFVCGNLVKYRADQINKHIALELNINNYDLFDRTKQKNIKSEDINAQWNNVLNSMEVHHPAILTTREQTRHLRSDIMMYVNKIEPERFYEHPKVQMFKKSNEYQSLKIMHHKNIDNYMGLISQANTLLRREMQVTALSLKSLLSFKFKKIMFWLHMTIIFGGVALFIFFPELIGLIALFVLELEIFGFI